MIRAFIVSLFLLLSVEAQSAETLYFNDNDTLNLTMSQDNINKILIEGDPIVALHSPEQYLTSENDASGGLYLQVNVQTPFTFYLGTELGHHIAVVATPVKSMGKTYVLISKTASQKARVWEETNPYEKTVLALMRGMMTHELPKGYGIEKSVKPTPVPFGKTGALYPRELYQGKHFMGVIYEFKNVGTMPLSLSEHDFYHEDVKAVVVSKTEVLPKESVFIYEVIGRNP